MKKCTTPSCPNEMKHPQSQLCGNCYNGIHYWMKKTPTQIINRKRKLRILDERLDDLRPANVVHLRRKRA